MLASCLVLILNNSNKVVIASSYIIDFPFNKQNFSISGLKAASYCEIGAI